MEDAFIRTRWLLGDEAMERLANARVAVFGAGGVGGYVCEGLARSGVGALDIIDSDVVSDSNRNRQIIATMDSVGQYKADVMAQRVLSINPAARVTARRAFFLPDNADAFPFSDYDYVVDAVDTVTAKIALVLSAQAHGKPILSAMGTGNKLDGSRLRICDLYETRGCPLARIMRKELRRRGVTALKVVCSDEPPLTPKRGKAEAAPDIARPRRDIPGSTVFVPAIAGLLIAGEVVRDLTTAQR